MRAAIAWSYELLAVPAQTLFRRAAVFIGGFNLDQAEAVGHAGETDVDVLEGLGHLVDHNLLRHRDLRVSPDSACWRRSATSLWRNCCLR